MLEDLRLFAESLRRHPGPPYALLFSSLILFAALDAGAPLWLFGPLAAVWWVPVLWTAWTRRGRYRDG